MAATVPISGSLWATINATDGSAQAPISPVFFTLSGTLLAWALLRQRLMQLVPIARSRAVDTIGDAMMVVDLRKRVLDANPVALALLALLKPGIPSSIIGLPVDEVAPAGIVAAIEQGSFAKLVELQPGLHLDVRITTVQDRKATLLGSVVLAHDVSEIHNQRLALAQVNTLMTEQLTVIEGLRPSSPRSPSATP